MGGVLRGNKIIIPQKLNMKYVEISDKDNGMMFMPLKTQKIRKVYQSDAQCAIWLFPYRNFNLGKLLGLQKQSAAEADSELMISTDPDNDIEMQANIMRFTPRPKFIRDAAAAFVFDTIGTWDILSLHWRYDQKDFMIHCNKGIGNLAMCSRIAGIDPVFTAQVLVNQ